MELEMKYKVNCFDKVKEIVTFAKKVDPNWTENDEMDLMFAYHETDITFKTIMEQLEAFQKKYDIRTLKAEFFYDKWTDMSYTKIY